MSDTSRHLIALISSYVPRRCGIATFSNDLVTAIAGGRGEALGDRGPIQVVALNDHEGEYQYGPEVVTQIGQHRRSDYRDAADLINISKVDVVLLQHEYGLFGGGDGDFIFELVDRLHKPLVTTLHTILSEPSPGRREVLRKVCLKSQRVVVMAKRARTLLQECYDVPLDPVKLIHHGVPDLPFQPTESFKERFGLKGRPTLLTFGLLSPSKGIETMLDAVAQAVKVHPDLAYIVLGVTHPNVKRESGESYRISLERKALELGIQANVLFHDRYVSFDDLGDYLRAADVYVTPYPDREQITSGTLAYAVASGRAVISTPYWHAQELLAEGRGRLVEFGDVDGFARNLVELLGNPEQRESIRKAAYEYGREMVWSRVGEQYHQVFDEAMRVFEEQVPASAESRRVSMRLSLPEIRLDHLSAMTDDTGIFQHAVYATPDRRHGYTTDDNARALIVTSMMWSLFKDERVRIPMHTYLSFLHYAQHGDTKRFRNFMSYDRRWLEEDGSDDCQGRVLWALGYFLAHAPSEAMSQLAADLFRDSAGVTETLQSPRSWALSVMGFCHYLTRFPGDARVRDGVCGLVDELHRRFLDNESSDWLWLEDAVTYDNARVPQALIMAGLALDRSEFLDKGLAVLDWLLKVQTADEGHLSPIGNEGWLQRRGDRAKFDQQPLEATALIAACREAHRATGDDRWLASMRLCFEWFLGRNDPGLCLVDFKSRGCRDGLKPSQLNENQGAESVVVWLEALLLMHEMQSVEPVGAA